MRGTKRARLGRGRAARGLLLAVLLLSGLAGCIHRYYETEHRNVRAPDNGTVTVSGGLRAHLLDGGVATFPPGARISRTGIQGPGMRYDFARRDSIRIHALSLDSVTGIESFNRRLNAGKTTGVSVAATIGTVVLTVAGLVAIACAADPKCFGSCPTVYTGQGSAEVLEAELFSYSIAPLLEGRDFDVIGGSVDSSGVLRLNIRNEAMESHFINHIELLEARHSVGERAVPVHAGGVLALQGERSPVRARDRDLRDVTAAISWKDTLAFATTETRLAAATQLDLTDHIDLTFQRPPGDSAALVFRLRNSLMNTVLFYDMMLGAAGAQSLNWMAEDLAQIGSAAKLGRWWASRMGMRIAVNTNNGYRQIARVPDTGPIAWSELAVLIPVPESADSTLQVRLSFAADEWRIDRVALADQFRRPETRTISAARVFNADSTLNTEGRQAIETPDEDYLYTVAGDRFMVEFEAGPGPTHGSRTFLLSTQGYYTEWVRPAWIKTAGSGPSFEPTDASLLEAMRRWHGVRNEFEARFYQTRIPTR
jgi:hypothetical protein